MVQIRWKSVKLREDTTAYLIRIAGKMQKKLGERVSIDDVIQEMIQRTESTQYLFEKPKRRSAGSDS